MAAKSLAIGFTLQTTTSITQVALAKSQIRYVVVRRDIRDDGDWSDEPTQVFICTGEEEQGYVLTSKNCVNFRAVAAWAEAVWNRSLLT